MKRAFDIGVSATALLLLSPILFAVALAVWLQDFHSPFYIAPRVARAGGTFRMVKFRSMTVGADRTGVDSTSASDARITPIGRFVRAGKLDELMQLWNVLIGDMSLVGPRPQVVREAALYTAMEQHLLTVKPGITDLSSIVFSDEGDILKGANDPDLSYHQLIRPWKSRLGLLYVQNRSTWLDAQCVFLTIVALVSRYCALAGVQRILRNLNAADEVVKVARRDAPLRPYPPPGSDHVVMHR